jgi:hypothetical protein
MNNFVMWLILVCACAGIASELITIIVPRRIVGMIGQDPAAFVLTRFYLLLFFLSGLYIIAVVLLVMSGIDLFRVYGVTILILSALGLIFKKILQRHIPLLLAESTINLILLLDVARKLVRMLW